MTRGLRPAEFRYSHSRCSVSIFYLQQQGQEHCGAALWLHRQSEGPSPKGLGRVRNNHLQYIVLFLVFFNYNRTAEIEYDTCAEMLYKWK